MNPTPLPRSLRAAALLGLACLTCAGSASAAGGPYSFQTVNDTFSGGDPIFPVTDDLTFTNLQIHEKFADGFASILSVPNLDTGTLALETQSFYFNGPTGGVLSDPQHGALTSAVLTGGLDNGLNPGSTLTLTLQNTLDPTMQSQQVVSDYFSASLFGAPSRGVGIGQFSLLNDGDNSVFRTVQINAAPVPEASTTLSLGLMLLLGLGGLAVARRRTAKAE